MSFEVKTASRDAPEPRLIGRSLLRGSLCRCPACGQGRMFGSYLKVAPQCAACTEELHHQRADDAPPYVVISIVGHVIVALILAVELAYQPPVWLHMALWLPLTVILSLLLLPPVKGSLVGLQWALRMHGFGGEDDGLPADGGLRPTPQA